MRNCITNLWLYMVGKSVFSTCAVAAAVVVVVVIVVVAAAAIVLFVTTAQN